jgi:small subunit ribosomal protein S6
MKNYELACIFKNGGDYAAMKEKVDGLLKEISAKVISVDDWGIKRFAYPVEKETEGYYYFVKFSAVPLSVQNIKKPLTLDAGMLRYMLLLDEHFVAEKDEKKKRGPGAPRPPRRHYQNQPQ